MYMGAEMMTGCAIPVEYPDLENYVDIEINWGIFPVGSARLYVETQDGLIEQISVIGEIKVGSFIEESINETLSLEALQGGRSLPIGLNSSPILIIEPTEMSENGGSAKLHLKRSSGDYSIEDLEIERADDGSFDVLFGGQQISKLIVYAEGTSESSLSIGDYEVE